MGLVNVGERAKCQKSGVCNATIGYGRPSRSVGPLTLAAEIVRERFCVPARTKALPPETTHTPTEYSGPTEGDARVAGPGIFRVLPKGVSCQLARAA